jgi:hypothetical protein
VPLIVTTVDAVPSPVAAAPLPPVDDVTATASAITQPEPVRPVAPVLPEVTAVHEVTAAPVPPAAVQVADEAATVAATPVESVLDAAAKQRADMLRGLFETARHEVPPAASDLANAPQAGTEEHPHI